MKKLLFLVLIIAGSLSVSAQQYKLLPDSCTYCMYTDYITWPSGYWSNTYYEVGTSEDTLIQGEMYRKVWNENLEDLGYFRQVGKKVYGLIPDSSMSEEVVVDFDLEIGDTITNILSINTLILPYTKLNALVSDKDSILLSNGTYHHFMMLEGYQFYNDTGWVDWSWDIRWDEKGVCTWDAGTLINTFPWFFETHPDQSDCYLNIYPCTTDTLLSFFQGGDGHSCENCTPILSNIVENNDQQVSLFPNPASDKFLVNSSSNEVLQIRVYTLSGEMIQSSFFKNSQEMNVEHYPSGF